MTTDVESQTGLQCALLEESFALVADRADELVGRFYEELFARYPAVVPMFAAADMDAQEKHLKGALVLVMENLRTPEKLAPALKSLGGKHQGYGAVAEHYGAVAETLVSVLAEFAGDAWTPEIDGAWREALDLIASTMLEAYHEEKNEMTTEAIVDSPAVPAVNGAVDRYFDALAVPAFTVDDRCKVTQWNAAVQELTGKSVDSMLGEKAWTAFFAKKQPNPVDAALIAEEVEEDDAFEFVNGAGETVTLHMQAAPIFAADGEIEGATVTLHGGGSGGRADEETLQRIADFEGQLEAVGKAQAVIQFNMDGTIIEANDNFLSVMDYTLDEIQGQHHSMFAEPDYRTSPEYRQFWEALNRGEYQAGEFKRLGKGGKEVWIQASYNPILDTSGKAFKVVKYATDVTQTRIQADQADRLQSAIEGSATAVMMVNRDLEITYANPATMELVGKHLEEFRSVFPGFDPDSLLGTCIDSFHKDPSHQRRILDDPRNLPYQTDIRIGSLTFALNITAIVDGDRGYIGNNLEWADVTAERSQADQASRLQSAIEGSATAVMMVNRDLEITYANPATLELVGKHLEEFRGAFPNFDPDKLIGTCIDSFHKDPSHQRRILDDPRNLPYQTDIRIGQLTFALNITAIEDLDGEYIGNNLEWADVTEVRAEATRATSLFSMIEGASAYFMMCDRDLRVTYLNPSLKEMLATYQSDLRQLFPSFDVDNIIGVCIDDFHKNPSHQRRLLDNINNMPYKAEIEVGGLEFGLTLTALMDIDGNHIGNAVEWQDLNSRATYRREIESLIEESKAGNLSYRANLDALDEVYRPMMEGIHEIIEAIVLPIQEAAAVLEKVADRDLTVRVEGEYNGDHGRIKDTLNQAAGNLDIGLSQVALASTQVGSAAGEISAGSQTLAQGASQQASSLEQIGSSLEEVTSMTKQNTANAQEARALTETAQGATTRGVDSMNRLSEAIDKIKTSADETAKIVKTIDEIAFQTNLLALNAAVEAARAGEAGKGFAVVAEEVRNLAMRSAEAAKNTAEMIQGSVDNAEGGVALNQEVIEHLEEIDTQVQKVNAMMSEIATSSDQQNVAIGQITTGVDQMNQVTQQNAANSEESASASEELSAQAAELQSLVGAFVLTETHQAHEVNGNGNGNGQSMGVAPQMAAARPQAQPQPRNGAGGRGEDLIPLDEGDIASLSQF